MRRWFIFLGIFFLATGSSIIFFSTNSKNAPPRHRTSELTQEATSSSVLGTTEETALVSRVIDGDTIVLSDGRRVRYIGIDTPEIVHPTKPVECFGYEAKEENTKLVLSKNIRLIKDMSDVDRYGRLLRYVYVGDVFVNDVLVREGFARASIYPPDTIFSELFSDSETDAHENNRGLWSACKPSA